MSSRLLVLAAFAACAGAGAKNAPATKAKVDALAYDPADAELVYSANLDALRTSSLWHRLANRVTAHGHPKLDQVARSCGIDSTTPFHAVRGAVARLSGFPTGAVFVVVGPERGQIEACLNRVGGRKPLPSGDGIWSLASGFGVAFLDPSTFVLASTQQVADSRAPLRSSSDFMEMFDTVDYTAAAWVILDGRFHGFDALRQKDIDITWAALSLTPGTDRVAFRLQLRFAKPEQAAVFLGDPRIKSRSATVEILQNGADVLIDGTLSDELFMVMLVRLAHVVAADMFPAKGKSE